jgi:hypothetical protein
MHTLIGHVQAGLQKFLDKRAGNDWLVRATDGAVCARLNGVFSLDEINAHIVAELTGVELADLIGDDFDGHPSPSSPYHQI